MKVVQNQSFWREILDALPVWLLVFRIDDQEEAHLIYANDETEKYVGFKPEEWVLKVETESFYQNEIASLVDEIAELSKKENVKSGEIALTDKWGEKHEYAFWFSLYKNKSQNSYHINVELLSSSDLEIQGLEAGDKNVEKKDTADSKKRDAFIAESGILKAIVNQIPKWLEHREHILISGPAGAGKKSLAKKIADMPFMKGKAHTFLGRSWKNEDGAVQIDWAKVAPHSVLLIDKIETLDTEVQQKLLEQVKEKDLQIIGTSVREPQLLIERGALSPDLYYQLGFQSVPLPSLKKRPGDVQAFVGRFVENVSHLFDADIELSGELASYIENQDWPENYKSLKELLRESVAEMSDNTLDIPIRLARQTFYNQEELFEEEKKGIEIISFDEMSRRYLKTVLAETGGKIYGDDGAAKLLEMPPTTLQSKLKKLGIK